ncbi:hypothetical protein TWF694_011223 [Orbilia ellipsospora]|uniref:Uncharacterized protein n=1 Tax=Orbilia ellipsospora TaxID=2528407 RepID=A0AAV9X8E2_9PEZI
MSERGYPIGIPGADGSPAWAKPPSTVCVDDPNPVQNHHDRSHCHDRPLEANASPRYLIPMGTHIPNPNGPGFIYLPPKDPRAIPCWPVKGIPPSRDDGMTATHLDHDARSYATQLPLALGGYGNRSEEELYREFARMRLQSEQNERFKMEEFERSQGLWDSRRRQEYERQVWAMNMGYRECSENSSEMPFPYTPTSTEDPGSINVHIRRPCKKCQDPVIVETQNVNHELTYDFNKGYAINLDGPMKNLNREVICNKCSKKEEEQAIRKELMREVVQEVFNATQSAHKKNPVAFEDAFLHSSRSRGRLATGDATSSNLNAYAHDNHHSSHRADIKKGEKGEIYHDRQANLVHHHRHRTYYDSNASESTEDSSTSESESELEIEGASPTGPSKYQPQRGHAYASRYAGDESKGSAARKKTIATSVSDGGESEDEVLIIRRRGKDGALRSHREAIVTESMKRDRNKLVDDVLSTVSPTRDEMIEYHSRSKRGTRRLEQEILSSTGSSDYSSDQENEVTTNAPSKKLGLRSAISSLKLSRSRLRSTTSRLPAVNLGSSSTKQKHRHQRRSSSVGDHPGSLHASDQKELRITESHGITEDSHYPKGARRIRDANNPSFLSGWSIFKKSTF